MNTNQKQALKTLILVQECIANINTDDLDDGTVCDIGTIFDTLEHAINLIQNDGKETL